MAQEAERIKKQDDIYADAYQKLARMFADEPATTERERTLVAALKQDEAAAQPALRKAAQLGLSNDPAAATKELMENARPPQRVGWRATELANFEDEMNEQAKQDAAATYASVRALVAAIVGGSLLVAVATTIVIARSILRQLGGEPSVAQHAAAQIADGNLMIDLPVAHGDSSSLMSSLDAMRALTTIVQGIKVSAESISLAAAEVAQGNVDLSQRTEEQAASLEKRRRAWSSSRRPSGKHRERAQGSTLAARGLADGASGGTVVKQVVGTMEDIASSSRRSPTSSPSSKGSRSRPISWRSTRPSKRRARASRARLRGGRRRGAHAGAAQRGRGQGDQGADRDIGDARRRRLGAGVERRPTMDEIVRSVSA
jgi:methyl-accepting chemotaxis protein